MDLQALMKGLAMAFDGGQKDNAILEHLWKNDISKADQLMKPVPEGVDKEKYDSCVEQVKRGGKAENAYAVCAASLQGEIKKAQAAPAPITEPKAKPEAYGLKGKLATMKKMAKTNIPDMSGGDKTMDKPSAHKPAVAKAEGSALERLKRMGETFMNQPKEEPKSLIEAVKRSPAESMKDKIGQKKEQAVYQKNESYNDMKFKESKKK